MIHESSLSQSSRLTLVWLRALLGFYALCLITSTPVRADGRCWPGTPIPGGTVSTTYTINAPGCYWLARDRKMTAAGPVISIASSHVFLDLRGQWLVHTVVGNDLISGTGVSDVTVVNGRLSGPPLVPGNETAGIRITASGGHLRISEIVIDDDGTYGLPIYGISVTGGLSPVNGLIANNMIEATGAAIKLENVRGSRIVGNVISGITEGPSADFGISLIGSSDNVIRENAISNIVGSGIVMDSSSHENTLDWNTVKGNLSGIFIAGQNNVYAFNRSAGYNVVAGNINGGNNF